MKTADIAASRFDALNSVLTRAVADYRRHSYIWPERVRALRAAAERAGRVELIRGLREFGS